MTTKSWQAFCRLKARTMEKNKNLTTAEKSEIAKSANVDVMVSHDRRMIDLAIKESETAIVDRLLEDMIDCREALTRFQKHPECDRESVKLFASYLIDESFRAIRSNRIIHHPGSRTFPKPGVTINRIRLERFDGSFELTKTFLLERLNVIMGASS